jgi:hypothetical protein
MPRKPQDFTLEPDEVEAEVTETDQGYRAVVPIRDVSDDVVFRFEIGPAILAQLLEKLDRIPLMPIRDALGAKYPGFYQLFLGSEPKYIGKTSRPIGTRLREHLKKLYGRIGISLDDVYCRYAFVEDPSLVDVAEGALIDFFSRRGMAEWNLSGFGSKAPGYGRGRTAESDWTRQFPPDLTQSIEAGASKPLALLDLVAIIRSVSPITFTVPRQYESEFRAKHTELHMVPQRSIPFVEWVRIVESLLAPGWRIDKQAVGWYIVRG